MLQKKTNKNFECAAKYTTNYFELFFSSSSLKSIRYSKKSVNQLNVKCFESRKIESISNNQRDNTHFIDKE